MPRGSYLIQVRRENLGMTQVDLAVDADLSRGVIQKAERGVKCLRSGTLQKIAESLGLDLVDVIHPDDVGSPDAFSRWPWSLSEFMEPKIVPPEHAYCRDASDADFAARSMRQMWTEHLARCGDAETDQGFQQADEKLNAETEAYCQRYVSTWKANPNTILFATSGEQRTGVCVVLPVTDKAFLSLRNGEISFMDVGPDDILPQSQNLVIDSAVELNPDQPVPWFRVVGSLKFALFYQIAALSIDAKASSFRMVSFTASETNTRRLRNMGFLKTKVVMPQYDYTICEFSMDPGKINDGCDHADVLPRSTTTGHYASLYQKFTLSKLRIQARRNVIGRSAQLYGRIAKRQSERTA